MQRLLAGFLAACCLLAAPADRARAEITAEQVREAIDRGVAFLKREQRKDGSWSEIGPQVPGGITGLVTLALLNAGVPADDPQIHVALAYLRKIPPTSNYSVALQTMVFSLAEPKNDGLLILRNVRWIEEQQKRGDRYGGAWGYPLGEGDNSNSQFAVLALYEAQRAGVPVSASTWRSALAYWKRTQNPDGSWGYKPGLAGTGSMTCAGIGAVAMALDVLEEGDARVEGDRVLCCGQRQGHDMLDRAVTWLARNFSVRANPGDDPRNYLLYFLYGLERTGRLTNQRFIGQHDWYREGADWLVKEQEDLSGFWTGTGLGENNPHVGTSFALLFLAKGRRPVVAAKLKHEPLDDWNHHRKDLANLVAYAERRWGRDLTWQVIDVRAASADDMMESPVLYLCGELTPELTDEEIAKLREYVNRGGFIFADAVCNGEDFDRGFRAVVAKMFPEAEYKLHLLPPEHAIWSAEERIDPKYLRALWGVDVGCRTSIVYCPENLSCYWELARPGREKIYPPDIESKIDAAKKIGINVLAYATNREPKYKLEYPHLAKEGPQDAFDRAKLYVATVKHSGGWNAAPMALPNLLRYLSGELGLRTNTDARELSLAEDRLFEFPVIFMHGRNAFRLSDVERKKLKTYLERGGVLFADAICSSEEFAAAFRHEMALVMPDHPLEKIAANDPMFSGKYGGFDLKTLARREPQRRGPDGPLKSNVRQVEPELEAVKLSDRYAVIFSRYDLSCALERHESLECTGYTRDDAARLGLNVVLYALHQ
ncbi:MAG: DUF4159 domain-containing protein [Planctomycetia bacterium]|nr:DUF4159 domain-containing protein [Planctomycetia bacterium]